MRPEPPLPDIGGHERVGEHLHATPLSPSTIAVSIRRCGGHRQGRLSSGRPDARGLWTLVSTRRAGHDEQARNGALGCPPNLPQGFVRTPERPLPLYLRGSSPRSAPRRRRLNATTWSMRGSWAITHTKPDAHAACAMRHGHLPPRRHRRRSDGDVHQFGEDTYDLIDIGELRSAGPGTT